MSPLDDFERDAVFDQNAILAAAARRAEASRRLSDKILAAFSHAYAVGEAEVARNLRAALTTNEARNAPRADKRRTYDPLGQADLWVAFIEARNDYKAVVDTGATDAAQLAVALERMKDAYRLWSAS